MRLSWLLAVLLVALWQPLAAMAADGADVPDVGYVAIAATLEQPPTMADRLAIGPQVDGVTDRRAEQPRANGRC